MESETAPAAEASATGAGSEAAATTSATTSATAGAGATGASAFLAAERFLGAGVAATTGAGVAETGAASRGVIVTVAVVFLATRLVAGAEEVIVLEAGIVFILLLRTGYIVKRFQTLNFYFFFHTFFNLDIKKCFSFEIAQIDDLKTWYPLRSFSAP